MDNRPELDPPESMPKFVVDVMLGSLARWLRILGYDTVYRNRIQDDEIVELSVAENRVALTRDTGLVRRRRLRRYVLIEKDDLGSQIRQTLAAVRESLRPDQLLVRCLECNIRLELLEREEARAEVPFYVYRTQRLFKRCRSCRRIYWGGTHRERILERLREMGLSV